MLPQMVLQIAQRLLDTGLSSFTIGSPIDAIADLHQQTLLAHPSQIVPWNTDGGKIAGPHGGAFGGESVCFFP
jgi:hypothetical protein